MEHIHNFENCSQVLAETCKLFGEPEGWFFRQLHQSILSLIDDSDAFYGVNEANPSPVLDAIALAAVHGIGAIELGDQKELQLAAKELAALAQPPNSKLRHTSFRRNLPFKTKAFIINK
ncbi:MAG TPA: hypothetical protein VMH05_09630 [Bryobacteraceae bacterium]|nr:hypothetical protein [Bryobacteraceae bacterium]